MFNLQEIAKKSDAALKSVFSQKIRGDFLFDIKKGVLEELGWIDLLTYYDLTHSYEKMITGLGEAFEYDICRMIVGIHRSHSIFLSDNKVRKNERSKKYKRQLISETVEKIKIRSYGSVHFRKKTLLRGEEFLYYPLPYELFVLSMKMSNMLVMDDSIPNCIQLYHGVVYNSISALTLLENNLFGTAYPLCRGAIEMYFKLLIMVSEKELYTRYEMFRLFEIEFSCNQLYPKEFNTLFEKRINKNVKAKADYIHFGWVDNIDGYHKVVKKSPYSVYGIITFLKHRYEDRISELECLERLYKSCHAYTHGSIQISKYPVLHYFEISLILYFIIRSTFLLLCEEKRVKSLDDEQDIISMLDRDFKILYNQYISRSTERFDRYYNLGEMGSGSTDRK